MNRLFIDGVEIELDDISFSYMYENSLFMFEKMKLNRTQSFKVNRTPTNDRIFNFAHLPQYRGTFIRTKKNANIYFPNGVIHGELLIREFNDSYDCIFAYGNIIKLKELRESGLIDTYLTLSDKVFWGATNPPVNSDQVGNYGIGKYLNLMEADIPNKINYLPSVKLKYLLEKSLLNFGITSKNIPTLINNVYIKRNDLGGSINYLTKEIIVLGGYGSHPTNPNIRTYFLPNNPSEISIVSRQFQTLDGVWHWVYGFRANKKMKVTTAMWDVIRIDSQTGQSVWGLVKPSTWGQLAFDQNMNYYNVTPKQLVIWRQNNTAPFPPFKPYELEEGQEIYFQLWNKHNFLALTPESYNKPDGWVELDSSQALGTDASNNGRHGLFFAEIEEFQEELIYNNYVHLQFNMPQCTAVDLILTISNLTKNGIIINDNEIEFFDYNFPDNNIIDITDKIISIKSVRRTFIDSAQKNIVRFDSLDYVKNNQIRVLEIENDNLPVEKELFVIPFSETNEEDGVSFSDDIHSDGVNFFLKRDGAELMMAAPNSKFKRIQFFPNSHLDNIYEKSTEVIAKLYMYQYEFHNIKEKTTFILKAKKYACSGGTWQKGIAELTLILLD